jgi:hypothetical protein
MYISPVEPATSQGMAGYGMLYASQASTISWPTNPPTTLATPVLITHPVRMMSVVSKG